MPTQHVTTTAADYSGLNTSVKPGQANTKRGAQRTCPKIQILRQVNHHPKPRLHLRHWHQQKYYPAFCEFSASDTPDTGTQIANQDAIPLPDNAPDAT